MIYLDWTKAKTCDKIVSRQEWQKKYSVHKSGYFNTQPYKMLTGTPLLLNIDGTCILADDVPFLCKFKKDVWKANRCISSIKSNNYNYVMEFKWYEDR